MLSTALLLQECQRWTPDGRRIKLPGLSLTISQLWKPYLDYCLAASGLVASEASSSCQPAGSPYRCPGVVSRSRVPPGQSRSSNWVALGLHRWSKQLSFQLLTPSGAMYCTSTRLPQIPRQHLRMKSTFIDNPSINPLGDPKINFTIQYISFYTQISKQTESEKEKFPIKQFPEKPNSTIQITKHL